MPIPQLPGIILDPNAQQDQLVTAMRDYVIRMEREMRFMMEDGLDSSNIFESGGWRVNPNQMSSLSGQVGMSSAGTLATSIRFWAGSADPTTAPYRVQEDGTSYSTKGFIGGWVIGAKTLADASGKVGFSVDTTTGTAPYLRIWAGNTTPASAGFRVYDDGSAYASNLAITGGSISVTTDVTIGNKLNLSATNFGNGIIWGTSGIQVFIDPAAGTLKLESPTGGVYIEGSRLASTKADKSSVNSTVYVSATSGGPATTAISFTSGVRTG